MPVDLNEIFKPSDMATLLSSVIIEKMTDEQKSGIMTQAFEFLLTPQKRQGDYTPGPGRTPVQDAFQNALRAVVDKVALRVVEQDPEVLAKVEEMVSEAIKANLGDGSAFRDAVAEGVRKAMTKSNY
jgi:nitrogen regulatory protein PII